MKKCFNWLLLTILVIALVVPVSLVWVTPVLADGNWLPDYSFRKEIPITGSGAGAAANNIASLTTGQDDQSWAIDTVNWAGQVFTAPYNETVRLVKCKLAKFGAPSLVYATLYAVDENHKPTTPLSSSGVTVGSTLPEGDGTNGVWREFNIGDYDIVEGIEYAVVMRTDTAGQYARWDRDIHNGYTPNDDVYSDDAGATWGIGTGKDRLFEVWSNETVGAGKFYTVPLTVHSGSGADSNGVVYLNDKCEDFPRDIRFTGHASAGIIPYWLAPGSGTPRTFHIQVPANLDDNQSIYIYYGNPTPTAFDIPPLGLWEKPVSAFSPPNYAVTNMVYDSTTNKYYICYYKGGTPYIMGLFSASSPNAASWDDEGTMLTNGGDPSILKYGGLWYMIFARSPNIHYATASSITGPYTEQGVLKYVGSEPGIFYNDVNSRWELLVMLSDGQTPWHEVIHLSYSPTLTGTYTNYGGNPVIPQGEADMYDERHAADAFGYMFTDNTGEKHTYYFYTTGRAELAGVEQRCVIAYTESDFAKRGVILSYDTSDWDSTVIKGQISRFGDYYYLPFTAHGAEGGSAVAKMYAKSTDSGFPPQQVFTAFDDFSENLDQWSRFWGSWSIVGEELKNTENVTDRLAVLNQFPMEDDAWEYSVKVKRTDLQAQPEADCWLGVAHAVRDQPEAGTLDCYAVLFKDSNYYVLKYVNNTPVTIVGWSATTIDVDVWNTITIRHIDDDGTYNVLVNDVLLYSGIADWDEGSFGVVKGKGASVFDDIVAKKWATTEPVVGTAYSEEQQSFPIVTTEDAANVAQTSATLQGNLISLGDYSPVYVSFEWGLTDSYGSVTDPQSKTETEGFSADLSDLTPNTDYYYRARARYGTGAYTYGSEESLTTLTAGPTTVLTVDATDKTATSAVLQGSLTSLGDYTPIYVSFQYGTSPSYGTTTLEQTKTSVGGFSQAISGLSSETLYYFEAVARYDDENSVSGDPLTFTTSMVSPPPDEPGIDPPDIMEIVDVKVFKDYLSPGDQVFVISYKLVYNAGNPVVDPGDYFDFQLVEGAALRAQYPVGQWGYKPGSIYLSPSSSVTWEGTYTVKLVGNPNRWEELPTPSTRVLTLGDWIGDLTGLDSWVISVAESLQSYYNTQMVVYAATGNILSSQGGVVFNMGIPGLSKVRPNLFSSMAGFPDVTKKEPGENYQEELTTANLGDYLKGALDQGAGMFKLDPTVFGNLIFGILYVFLVTVIAAKYSNVPLGMGVGTLVVLGGAVLGLVSLALITVVSGIIAVYVVYSLWIRYA